MATSERKQKLEACTRPFLESLGRAYALPLEGAGLFPLQVRHQDDLGCRGSFRLMAMDVHIVSNAWLNSGLQASFDLMAQSLQLPLQATLNHSCEPNVTLVKANADDERDGRVVGSAARDIAAGEELFNPYIDVNRPLAERKLELAEYGFVCCCAKCERDTAEAQQQPPPLQPPPPLAAAAEPSVAAFQHAAAETIGRSRATPASACGHVTPAACDAATAMLAAAAAAGKAVVAADAPRRRRKLK